MAERAPEDLEIVSGATVTIMVIDDSILRSGIKAAQALGLEGFEVAQTTGPTREVDRDAGEVTDWETLAGNGALRRMTIDVGTINADFAAFNDPRTEKETEDGPDDAAYVDIWAALVSQPAIGRSLLGDGAYDNLVARMEPGTRRLRCSAAGAGRSRGRATCAAASSTASS